jgi:glycosyltransferase involved in cell wall biosynthesis
MNIIVISPFDVIPEDGVRPGRLWNYVKNISFDKDCVIWITSRYSHLNKKYRTNNVIDNYDILPNIHIIKIDVVGYSKNIGFKRILNHTQFGVRVYKKLKILISNRKPDVILCAMPPLLTPFFVSLFGRRYGVPVIVDVIDAWPEAFERFIKNPFLKKLVFPPFRIVANNAVRMAHALTGVSDDYVDQYKKYSCGKPRKSFHLGHSLSGFRAEIQDGWNGIRKENWQRWVTYVGTVSLNYDLDTVILASRSFPDVKFLIVGKGEGLEYFRREVEEKGVKNVALTGEVPYHDLVNILYRSDIGLLAINNGAWIRFPFKANDYFVAGLPVMNSIRGGEIERVVSEWRIGETYREGDVQDFVEKLTCLLSSLDEGMKERALRYGAEHCDSDRIYREFHRWISVIAAKEAV